MGRRLASAHRYRRPDSLGTDDVDLASTSSIIIRKPDATLERVFFLVSMCRLMMYNALWNKAITNTGFS